MAAGPAALRGLLSVLIRPRPGSMSLKRVLSYILPVSTTVIELRERAGLPPTARLLCGRLPFTVFDHEFVEVQQQRHRAKIHPNPPTPPCRLLGALFRSGFGLPSGPPCLVFSVE